MRVCCLSDLHGHLPEVPESDLLVLAGDYCRNHRDVFWYRKTFRTWLEACKERTKYGVIGIAGNHDFAFERDPLLPKSLPWTYLCHDRVEVNGFKVYGHPYQPIFNDWAFNVPDDKLYRHHRAIPDDTDIVVVHAPPYLYGDAVPAQPIPLRVGSKALAARIMEIQPKLVVCGHVHEGYGVYQLNDTIIVNASLCDASQDPRNKPIIIDLTP